MNNVKRGEFSFHVDFKYVISGFTKHFKTYSKIITLTYVNSAVDAVKVMTLRDITICFYSDLNKYF